MELYAFNAFAKKASRIGRVRSNHNAAFKVRAQRCAVGFPRLGERVPSVVQSCGGGALAITVRGVRHAYERANHAQNEAAYIYTPCCSLLLAPVL